MTSGKVEAACRPCARLAANCCALLASRRPGNRFSYSVGSASESAAFLFTVDRLAFQSDTTLGKIKDRG